jgi:hypothetical protein
LALIIAQKPKTRQQKKQLENRNTAVVRCKRKIKEKIMAKIAKVYARQIMDSRGNPTVECDVY